MENYINKKVFGDKQFNSVEEAEYAILDGRYQDKSLDYLYESRRVVEECIEECIKKVKCMEKLSLEHLAGFWREQYVLNELIKRREDQEKPRVIN